MRISSSMLKLEPGEAVIDPVLPGLARISKKMGENTYTAWVDASQLKTKDTQQFLACFPDTISREDGKLHIRVNDWTTWRIPAQDKGKIQWLKPERPQIQFAAPRQPGKEPAQGMAAAAFIARMARDTAGEETGPEAEDALNRMEQAADDLDRALGKKPV